jgi:hypothetical protein
MKNHLILLSVVRVTHTAREHAIHWAAQERKALERCDWCLAPSGDGLLE